MEWRLQPVSGTVAAWRALFLDDTVGARAAATALLPVASREGRGRLAVELAVIDALAACAAGDLAAAGALARRALLKAQAEAIPSAERMAALALARVRRRLGRPHLAMHVLAALASAGANHFREWLAWEVLLSGGEDMAARVATGLPRSAAAAGVRLLAAARAGDRAMFDAAAVDLAWSMRGIPDGAREADTLVAALDIGRACPLRALTLWRAGDNVETPLGLDGLGLARQGESVEDVMAFVVAGPGVAGARVLRPGLALTPAVPLSDRTAADGAGARTDMALAALALAGPGGLPRDTFFARVYGFAFVQRRHQAVLDMLVHRMRARLGSRGEIDRASEGGPLALAVQEWVSIPDPRCSLGAADRVLWAIARLGTASAQEAAAALRMPLRAVQNVVRQLIEDGACGQIRAGRQIRYRVSETTFTSLATAALAGAFPIDDAPFVR